MGEVVFCVIDESGCSEEDVGVAVFNDVCDREAVAARASSVIPGERPEFV